MGFITYRSEWMSGKNPFNLLQNQPQSLSRTLLQKLTGIRGFRQCSLLILCCHIWKNWSLPPSHTPFIQFNPNGYIFHFIKPWRCNCEGCNQGHIQRPTFCSVDINCKCFHQIIKPKNRGRRCSWCLSRHAGGGDSFYGFPEIWWKFPGAGNSISWKTEESRVAWWVKRKKPRWTH